MKAVILASLFAFVVGDTAVSGPAIAIRPDWTNVTQGVRILPRIEETRPLDGAKRKDMVYGPYSLSKIDSVTKLITATKSPCQDCFVTALQYTLRYPDGREVLTSDGIWLHHCLLTSRGRTSSITPYGRNVLSSGGNERPTLRLNTRYKYGIDWPSTYNINLMMMSEIQNEVEVNLVVSFEYIEKKQPEARGYRDTYMKWNGGTRTPDLKTGTSSFKSQTWKVTRAGTLLHAMGHMHDGGSHIDLYVNDRIVCSSRMYYGTRAGYGGLPPGNNAPNPKQGALQPKAHNHNRRSALVSRDGPHDHMTFGGVHISAPGHCDSFGRVEKGDNMYIISHYNTAFNKEMSLNGDVEANMGIIRVYIGPDSD